MLRCFLMLMASHFAPHDVTLQWNPAAPFWRDVPATVIVSDNFGAPHPAYKTEVRSRWTEQNLYFQFTCHYRELYLHPHPRTAVETDKLWNWDVAEVFIGSDLHNIKRYREFEMSPQGEWIDLDVDRGLPGPADLNWNSGFEVKASIDEKNHIWYGAMRIPYRAIDSRPAAVGNMLRMNIYREQGPLANRVEIAWQPTMQRSFHVPEQFGTLRLTQ